MPIENHQPWQFSDASGLVTLWWPTGFINQTTPLRGPASINACRLPLDSSLDMARGNLFANLLRSYGQHLQSTQAANRSRSGAGAWSEKP